MSEISRIALPIFVAVILCGVAVLLGRMSNAQFAIGSALLCLIAFVVSVTAPSVINHGSYGFWQEGYATVFPFISALYSVAHTAIWRSFKKPGWLTFFAALPATWFFASAGFWEVIV
jgi:hypothetical protein